MQKQQRRLRAYRQSGCKGYLLVLILLCILSACGSLPIKQSVASTPSSTPRTGAHANIVLYATNAAPYNTTIQGSSKDTVTALRASDGSLLWRFQTDGVVSTENEHALLVVDSVVYITTNRLLNAATPNVTAVSSVYALRAMDGTLLWHYQVKNGLQPLAVTGGMVYITANGLFALRASDGVVLWHRQIDAPVTNLIADHGILYISTGLGSPGSVFALHANDGSLAWQVRMGQQGFDKISLADGIIYVGGAKSAGTSWIPSITLYALRASDGRLLWHTQSNLLFFTGVSNGIIYLNTIGTASITIFALRARDGTPLWHRQDPRAYRLSAQGEVLYAFVPTQGPVSAIRAGDGTPLWATDFPAKDVDGASPTLDVLTDNERVYISSAFVNNGFAGSSLEVRKASDGTVLWHYPYQKLSSIFKLVNGVVYVGASGGFYQGDHHSGSVCALQASTGTKLWCHQANTGVAPLTIA